VEWIDEAYSTSTCSVSGYVQPCSPRGRRFRCSGCGARVHRDVNGSATSCSKATHGVYSKVQADTVTYLRPIGGAPLTRATSSELRLDPPGFSRGVSAPTRLAGEMSVVCSAYSARPLWSGGQRMIQKGFRQPSGEYRATSAHNSDYPVRRRHAGQV